MSTLTRPDAVHVDIIGDKNGAPRVQTLGTASILGILPEGHVWTVARANGEAECCGTFHVDVEGQTTYIRCVTSGHTILSGRGLVKTLQMMADMGNAPVIVSHDPGASSTIKNAEYTPSGEFAPVAPVTEVDQFGHCTTGKCGTCADCAEVATVAEDAPGFDEAMAEAEADEDPEGTAVEAAMGQIKTTGRVFVAEAHNFGGRAPFDTLVRTGWATLVNDGDMSRWVRTRYTADRKRITDGLAVWDYNLNAGRVVLSTIDGEGWFNVDTADGRSLMDGVRVTTVHPFTRQTASDALAATAHPVNAWGPCGPCDGTDAPMARKAHPCGLMTPLDIPAPGEAEALQAEHDAAMSAWSAPLVSILTIPAPVVTEAEVWKGTGTTLTPVRCNRVHSGRRCDRVRRSGACPCVSLVVRPTIKHKRTKVNARRVRGGF